MKRLPALALAFLILIASLASLVSCAGTTFAPAISANIRLTSSDGESAAAWLSARLGDKLTDSVVLGTDADGYGVSLDALEADGYFIRSLGGEVALFARTADGLDRAARKYAKMVEAGAVTDVTYHEGYRVKRITIAGRDISEYTVYYEDDARLKSAAANELVPRIKEACGASLPAFALEPAAPYIALRYVHDDSQRNVGYRWSVTEDGLVIECSDKYKTSSGFVAVERFLQDRLDWFGLHDGIPDLTPAELIEIEAGESGGETPAFDYMNLYYNPYIRYEKVPCNPTVCGPHIAGSHGIQYSGIARELSKTPDNPWLTDQPCYLDEDFYEISLEDVTALIEQRIAAGEVPGEENFTHIKLGMPDNNGWCKCKKCADMLRAEGSRAAWTLTWINRLSEELAPKYPGLTYGAFAYAGTNKLPKTIRPNEHIIITYCYDGCCSAHPLDGSRCTGDMPLSNDMLGAADHTNQKMTADLLEWLAVTPNVVVYYYGLLNRLITMSYVHTVWDDVRFIYNSGAIGVHWESEYGEYDTGWLASWLATELAWNIDMSREEYDAIYDRILRVMYGDAGQTVKEYIAREDTFHENGPCVACWFWDYPTSPSLPTQFWKLYYDEMFELTERARLGADSAIQQRRLDNLSISCIYKGTVSNYFAEYNAGNDARIAQLSRRWALIDERATAWGLDMATELVVNMSWQASGYDRDMEVEMWRGYTTAPGGAKAWYPDKPEREMPERVAAILSEREAN